MLKTLFVLALLVTPAVANPNQTQQRLLIQWENAFQDCRGELPENNFVKQCRRAVALEDKLKPAGCYSVISTTCECR
jgi:hypothetical protein